MATRSGSAVVSLDVLYAAAFVRGLGGAALAALVVTVHGDRLGRRRALVTLALLAAVGGAPR